MRRLSVLALSAVLVAANLFGASKSWFQLTPVKEGKQSHLRLVASEASVSEILSRLQPELDRKIVLDFDGDRQITLHVKRGTAEELLQRVAEGAKLTMLKTKASYIVRDPEEPAVTLDVKDADVRFILQEVRSQCEIKNMIIDPQVTGTGTFLFNEVPCKVALRTILSSLGLGSEPYPDLLWVTPR